MFRIKNKSNLDKITKELCHEFLLMVEKIVKGYRTFLNLIIRIWKKITMAKDTIFYIFYNF